MGTTQQNYNTLKAEIGNSMYYSGAYSSGLLEEKHIIGMAKLGFSTMAQGEAFAKARDAHASTKSLFTSFGDKAASDNKYNSVMKAVGDKFKSDPNLFNKLDRDFSQNPAIAKQMMTAIDKNPTAAANAIRAYTGQDTGSGRLETLVGRINQNLDPITGASLTAKSNAPLKSETPLKTSNAPPKTQSSKPDPMTVTANAADRPPTSSSVEAAPSVPTASPPPAEVISPVAGISGAPKWKAEDVAKMADPMADKFKAIMGDEQVNIEGFRTSLKTNKTLQAQIAENFNNNPEFVDQMMKLATEKSPDGKETESERLLKQHGRPTIKEIVGNPALLADDKYVDNLTGKLSMASGGGFDIKGMIAKLSDWIGIDLNALLGPIAELCQKGMAACQEFFGSGKAMSMASNIGDSVRSLSVDAADAIQNATSKKSDLDVTTRYDRDGKEIQPVNENKTPAPEQGIRVAQSGPQPAGGNLKPPVDLLAGTGFN